MLIGKGCSLGAKGRWSMLSMALPPKPALKDNEAERG